MIRLPDFIIIPYPLLEDKGISLIDERLYGVIYWLTQLKNDNCTASNETLAGLIKSTARSVQNSLLTLENKGYIKRTFEGGDGRHRKEIVPLITYARTSVPHEQPFVPLRTMGDSPLRTMGDQNKNVYNKNNKQYSTDFVEFWNQYPKKVGKPTSHTLWLKLTPEDKTAIMADLVSRKLDRKWLAGFIKDPERYLKYRQWEDEIIRDESPTKVWDFSKIK